MTTMLRRWLIGAALAVLLVSGVVQAQDPERRTELVYGVNAALGNVYEGVFYPAERSTLFLIADSVSIISPRMTQVYYWPITNKQVADWDAQNDPVVGILEIRRRGRQIQQVEQTDYLIQYPDGRDRSTAQLYLGDQAHQQWAHFEQLRDQFRRDVSAYYQDLVSYRQDLDDRIAAGELTGEPSAPPVEPAPFVFSSTEINRGFPVALPPGRYTIRIVDSQGQTIPRTQRRLEVFAPVAHGVAYSVIPHDRYTFPELSDDVGEVIYLRDDAQVYLQPYAQQEFQDRPLTRLQDPQATTGRPDLYRWQQQREIESGTLVVASRRLWFWPRRVQLREIEVEGRQVTLVIPNNSAKRIERRPYAIRQITGAALGYEIHDQTTTTHETLRERRPAFHGYWLNATTLPYSSRIYLEGPDGTPIPGSERRVQVVRTQVPGWSLLLSSLPFAAALLITGLRRRRFSRLPRDME